jgi:hypothetical protein
MIGAASTLKAPSYLSIAATGAASNNERRQLAASGRVRRLERGRPRCAQALADVSRWRLMERGRFPDTPETIPCYLQAGEVAHPVTCLSTPGHLPEQPAAGSGTGQQIPVLFPVSGNWPGETS